MMLQGRSFSGRERNCCFLNTLADPAAKGRFANISATSGLDFPDDGRAVAVVDWDHDGDLDLWISNRNAPRIRMLRNNAKNDHHFLAVRLVGNGKTTNRDAIGARVKVISKNVNEPQIKTLRAGEGYLAQSSKWLYFGLGDTEAIEKVQVQWPGGEQETFTGLEVDARYHLTQGSGKAVASKRTRGDLALRPSTPKILPKVSTARIPLVSRFPLPKGSYQGLDGRRQPLPLGRGQSVLINLWSVSCRPCLAELKEFTEREQDLRAAGIEIVALSVDRLTDAQADPATVESTVSRLSFPFSVGFTSAELLKLLQMYHDRLIPLERPLPLPSSFLLDGKGRLVAIYEGPVSVDQLLDDAQHGGDSLLDRRRRAALLPGRILRDEVLDRLALTEQSVNTISLAAALDAAGREFDVISHYEAALRERPDNTDAHVNLGVLLHQLGRYEDSIAHFKEALRYKPHLSGAHNNWANSLGRMGRLEESVTHYKEAVRLNPDNSQAHNNLGIALDDLGRFEEAIRHFKEALRIKPDFYDAQSNWGGVLNRTERFEDAVAIFEKILRSKPNHFEANINCGNTMMSLERFEEAISRYQKALQIKPNHAQAHNNVGFALGKLGRHKEAVKYYREAIRYNAKHAKAHNNFAWLLATCPDKTIRNGQQALAHAQRAYQITSGKIPPILETIAAAHAELGNFTEAVRWQEKAIQLASKKEDEDRSARLELYKQRRPYRKSK
jgi:tetratricopeptide (TPR) repeat protein/peroxiredoxin